MEVRHRSGLRISERTALVGTGSGELEVFIAHPERLDASGSWPVIIQLTREEGTSEERRREARRTALWCYYVMAPDLRSRRADHAAGAASKPASDEQAARDVRSLLDLARGDPAARDDSIGLYDIWRDRRLTVTARKRVISEWQKVLLLIR
jgi:dienelactone hydrolase